MTLKHFCIRPCDNETIISKSGMVSCLFFFKIICVLLLFCPEFHSTLPMVFKLCVSLLNQNHDNMCWKYISTISYEVYIILHWKPFIYIIYFKREVKKLYIRMFACLSLFILYNTHSGDITRLLPFSFPFVYFKVMCMK